MKKNLAKKITLSILAGAVLMSTSNVWAAVTTPPPGDGWTRVSGSLLYHANGKEILLSTNISGLPITSAYGNGADATGGKVTITGGSVITWIYGGLGHGTGTAKQNTVTISDGDFTGKIYGGYSHESNATNNTVTISGGIFSKYIYGGHSPAGFANNNAVNISSGTFTDGKIYGGYALNDASYNNGGNANDNTVTISGGKFNGQDIYGGYAYGNGAIAGNNLEDYGANRNIVEINGASAGSTFGDIYGGWTEKGYANDNIVTLYDGTFAGMVAGGRTGTGNGGAIGNTVTISGDANVKNADLYGGAKDDGSGGYEAWYAYSPNQTNPNILTIGTPEYSWANLHNTSRDNNVKSIQGFDEIVFEHVKWDTVNPAVKVENLEFADSPGTKITVNNLYVAGDDETFKANAKMTLIDSDSTEGDFDAANSKVAKIHRGVARIYEAEIVYEGAGYNTPSGAPPSGTVAPSNDDNDREDILIVLGNEELTPESPGFEELYGTSTYPVSGPSPKRNDQVLVVGESRAVATAFTDQGSELVELGINALARDEDKDYKVFAALYGNASEYATGSHVKVNGWSGIVGVGKTNANGLTVGAFFENGEGNYRTYNDVNGEFMRGDGEACYNGGGILVRKDNANGVYTELALRAGNLQNELRNAVRGSDGLMGYDIDTFYYGAQVGIGKIIPRGAEGDSIDVYGKFIYTHHDDEDFKIDGDEFHFDSVQSQRLRLGFRINEVQTNKLAMYYGAAWEYEFGGDADNTVVGYDLSTPSLEGSTVIGEIGMHYKASDKWSLDLNARAYTGQREGFSGSVQANYSF